VTRRGWAGVAVAAGALLVGTGAIPRLRERAALSELRAAGEGMFGDPASADAYARGQLQVRSHLRFEEKLDAIARTTPAAASAGRMAALGYIAMARLPADELVAWLELRGRLAERSPAVCAGLWKGGVSAADLTTALRDLSAQDKRRWIETSVRAATLELDADAPPPAIPLAAESRAWASLLVRLPADSRALIERAADRKSPIGDDDACRAFRILVAHAKTLPAAERDDLIRAVTCPFLVVR
jgi:hypothetical protein